MQITAAMVKELRERTGAGMMDCKKALVAAGGDIELAIENMRKAGQAKADKKAGRVAAEGRVAVCADPDSKVAVVVDVNCETDFVAKGDEFGNFVSALAARALSERAEDVDTLAALPMEAGGSQSIEAYRRDLVAKIGENITLRRVALMASDDGRIGSYVHGGRIGVLVEVSGGDESLAHDLALHIAASRPLAVAAEHLPAGRLAKEREILQAQVAESGKPPEICEKMVAGRLQKYLNEVTLLGQPFVKDADLSVAEYLAKAGAGVRGFMRFEVGEGIERKSENFAEEVMSQVRRSGASA